MLPLKQSVEKWGSSDRSDLPHCATGLISNQFACLSAEQLGMVTAHTLHLLYSVLAR